MQYDSTVQLDAYSCGTNSTIWFSRESGPVSEPMSTLSGLQAPSLNLVQATSPLSELANMNLDTTQLCMLIYTNAQQNQCINTSLWS